MAENDIFQVYPDSSKNYDQLFRLFQESRTVIQIYY